MPESLPDTELLIRRFDPNDPGHAKPLENQNLLVDQGNREVRMTSGALFWHEEPDYPDHRGCSVYRDEILREKGMGREEVLSDPSWLIAGALVQHLREIRIASEPEVIPLDAWADPLDREREGWHERDDAHALITVPKSLLAAISDNAKKKLYSAAGRKFSILPFAR